MLDGIFDDGGGVEVARVQDVGDVAVREDIAGVEAEDGGFRHTGVGAANPEDRGVLAFGEGGEEVGFLRFDAFSPCFVVGEGVGKGVCRREGGRRC